MSEAQKKCPHCAELVKSEAIVCRYCGFKFIVKSEKSRLTPSQRAMVFGSLALLLLAINFGTQIADLFRPKPVEISLVDLERQFDASTPEALQRWRGNPMILTAIVASGQGDSVALESINPMAVHAELNESMEGHDGAEIRLHCRDIKEGGLIGGKPQPLNCSVLSLSDQ